MYGYFYHQILGKSKTSKHRMMNKKLK